MKPKIPKQIHRRNMIFSCPAVSRADLAGGGHYAFRLMKQQKIDQTAIEKKDEIESALSDEHVKQQFHFQ